MGYKYCCEKVLQKKETELIGYKTVANNVVKHGWIKLMGPKNCCEKLVCFVVGRIFTVYM